MNERPNAKSYFPKIMIKTRFLLLLAGFVLPFFLSAQTLRDQLAGERWGLEHMIQPYEARQISDTLFSAIDCQNEFLELREDNTYTLRAQDKRYNGTWEVSADSMLYLKKKNDKPRTLMRVMTASRERLKVVEIFKGQTFIYDYFRCTEANQDRSEDTRQSFEVTRFTGITTGIHAVDQSVEVGLAWGKVNWDKLFWATGPSLEFAPWNDLYGASWGFWSNKGFAVGLHLNAFTDLETVQLGLEPGIGFGLPFLGERGRYAQIVYSYNFLFLDDQTEPLPQIARHNISLRMVWPFRREVYQVRKLQNRR